MPNDGKTLPEKLRYYREKQGLLQNFCLQQSLYGSYVPRVKALGKGLGAVAFLQSGEDLAVSVSYGAACTTDISCDAVFVETVLTADLVGEIKLMIFGTTNHKGKRHGAVVLDLDAVGAE